MYYCDGHDNRSSRGIGWLETEPFEKEKNFLARGANWQERGENFKIQFMYL